ncbi:SEL1-like repeat protein [Pedobacter caeni]|nr:SEL1-like repeat protein [Pedobacter caeni]
MAHRIYLYNFSHSLLPEQIAATAESTGFLDQFLAGIGGNTEQNLMMVEWNYEFPLFLHPLFVRQPFISTPMYNGTEGGIYAPASPGIQRIKEFYEFIDKHKEQLIDNKAAFDKAKQRIFNFLDQKVVHDFFHLDAWDVFNMDDVPHKVQAIKLLNDINTSNAIIAEAIAQDNPALLNNCPEFNQGPLEYQSFRPYLNHSGYDYGWEVITSGIYDNEEEEEDNEHPDQIFYKENEYKGMKDDTGKVLIPAHYDEVYYFPEGEELALVQKNNKYGYVNRQGEEMVSLQFDDAYDLCKGIAIVKLNDKYGLLQALKTPDVDFLYDDITDLSLEPHYFNVCKEDTWAVVNANNDLLLPFEYLNEIDCHQYDGYNLYTGILKSSKQKRFFLQDFQKIGTHKVTEVHWAGYEKEQHFFVTTEIIATGDKNKLKLQSLIRQDGETILPLEYEQINYCSGSLVYILKQKGKSGLFRMADGLLLPCIYNRIDELHEGCFRVFQSGKVGLFDAWEGRKTFISPQFDSMRDYIRRNKDGSWEILGFLGNEVSLVYSNQTVKAVDHEIAARQLSAAYYPESMADEQRKILSDIAGTNAPALDLYHKGADAFNEGDIDNAIKYHLLAAEKGDADSMNDLGFIYSRNGIHYDANKAYFWYRKGTKAGSVDAMNGFGICHLNGIGVSQNIDQAIRWYERAAEYGSGRAHANLADLYLDGIWVQQNLNKALKHYQQAEQHDYPSYGRQAYVLSLKEDYSTAITYYKISVKEGDAQSAHNLALMYELGQGCRADSRKALTLYHKAVELGDAESYLELIRLYRNDEEVKDEGKALEMQALARAAGIDIPDENQL